MTTAAASPRTMWKGAVSFGLVHIPVALYSATADVRPKFNLIDKASMSRVGNKQVSKETGEAAQEIVKGLEVGEGTYVVLSKEEIRAALPRSTQLLEIERFVPAADIPTVFYNKPYYVEPAGKGFKAFMLLRDTLAKTGMAGIARVVISTRQHLAALVPVGKDLVLNLLRWEEEVRAAPAVSADAGASAPTDREYAMAEQLVRDMADAWAPGLFHDQFKEQLQKLVEAKQQAGELAQLQPLPGQEMPPAGADVIDLTELLRRSLASRPQGRAANPAPAKHQGDQTAANDETPARRAAASKTSSRARSTTPVAKRPKKSG